MDAFVRTKHFQPTTPPFKHMLNKTKLFSNRLSNSCCFFINFLLYYWPPENFEQKQTSRSTYRREYGWQLQSLLQCVMTGKPDWRASRKNAVRVAKTISSSLCYSWLAKTIADNALEGFTTQKCLEEWLWNWVPKEQNKNKNISSTIIGSLLKTTDNR